MFECDAAHLGILETDGVRAFKSCLPLQELNASLPAEAHQASAHRTDHLGFPAAQGLKIDAGPAKDNPPMLRPCRIMNQLGEKEQGL